MKISNQINDPGKILEISKARIVEGYKIELFFSDGTNVVVDFYPFLSSSGHPDIRKYVDESLFRGFKIINGNLNWNDFDMIFPVEDLYRNDILHLSQLAIV